jgi:hypothetical protein
MPSCCATLASEMRSKATQALIHELKFLRRAVLTFAADRDYGLLLHTAFYTGMRLGELLGLRWRDLDLDAGVVFVRQQYDAVAHGFRDTKSYHGRRALVGDQNRPRRLLAKTSNRVSNSRSSFRLSILQRGLCAVLDDVNDARLTPQPCLGPWVSGSPPRCAWIEEEQLPRAALRRDPRRGPSRVARVAGPRAGPAPQTRGRPTWLYLLWQSACSSRRAALSTIRALEAASAAPRGTRRPRSTTNGRIPNGSRSCCSCAACLQGGIRE